MQNIQILLKSRPNAMPLAENWQYNTQEINENSLSVGEFLIKTHFISLDPAMRGWISEAKSYIAPVQIDEVMRASTAGEVIFSQNADFPVGTKVVGMWGTQEYTISNGKGVSKVDTTHIPLSVYMGMLGGAGLTGYFGLLEVGKLKEGDSVLVSGAGGAVGMTVGQIAKIKGCKVIGIAGGKEKCDFVVNELGFDACIDYKNEDIKKMIRTHLPQGIDVYFDNVGGEILDIALAHIRRKARIVICGAISQYNNMQEMYAPKNYLSLLVNSASMEGFVIFDFAKEYSKGIIEMSKWILEGKLKYKEHFVKGLENFPNALQMLFKGENLGKLVLEV
jgi:NADPH-dependent curcumin reductase